jgi:predicted nucleic acid-binding protein
MPFALDNSVVTGWYLLDQSSEYTAAVAKRLEADQAIVPAIWQLELANVLKTACTRGKLTVEVARQITDTLGTLPITVDSGPAPGARQLLELALRHQLSSYDAAYLELAMRRGVPLASQDVRLREAAIQAGVGLV